MPASAQPVEVVQGKDLAVWRDIPHAELTADQRQAVYGAFIRDYPSSALAEVAWRRLDAQQRQTLGSRGVLTDLERSRQVHDMVLERISGEVSVVELNEMGDVPVLRKRWIASVQAGASLDGDGAWATGGLRVGRGAWSGTWRLARGSGWSTDATLRLNPGWWGPLYVEAGACLRGERQAMALAGAGVRTRIFGETWLETSLGAGIGQSVLTPVARIEIAHQLF